MLPRPARAGRTALVVAVVTIGLAVGITALGMTGVLATHEEERSTDGFKAYTPGGEIPNPGETYTVELYMTPAFMEDEGPLPADAEVRLDYAVYYSTTMSDCDVDDVYTLGIDRGNNNTGTETDEDMVQSLKRNGDYATDPSEDPAKMTTADWDHRHVNWLEFPDEDDFIEELRIHEGGIEDQLIVGSEDCVEMGPTGWHRTFGYMNGTITELHGDNERVEIDGETYEEGDHFEIWEPSLWYPVCDCDESRHVSMELSPPPGAMTPGSEGGVYHPNGTVEAPYAEIDNDGNIDYGDFTVPPENVTSEGIVFHDGFLELTGPIYYAQGHIEADGTIVTPNGDRIEPDEDESAPTPTPTETSAETPTPTETATPTPTQTQTGDEGSETNESGDTDETTNDESEGDETESDETGQDESDADSDEDVGATPTVGDGAGFSAFAAFLAVLGSIAVFRWER